MEFISRNVGTQNLKFKLHSGCEQIGVMSHKLLSNSALLYLPFHTDILMFDLWLRPVAE